MAKLALNKSALSAEKKRYIGYQKYLPSLELKQQQLLAERKKHEHLLEENRQQIDSLQSRVREQLPMLAIENIRLSGLIEIEDLQIGSENLLGTRLPTLENVACKRMQYSFLSRPHWVDSVASTMEEVIRLRLEEKVLGERIAKIHKATRIITQRVNLFSKVLIPQSSQNIKRIGLFLADQDRAAVVRSKIAKQKNLERDEGGLS